MSTLMEWLTKYQLLLLWSTPWRVRYSTTYPWWGALSLKSMVYPLVHTLLQGVHPLTPSKGMHTQLVCSVYTTPHLRMQHHVVVVAHAVPAAPYTLLVYTL